MEEARDPHGLVKTVLPVVLAKFLTYPEPNSPCTKAAAHWGEDDDLPDAGGWTAGVGLDDLKRVVAYWRDTYDWRKIEHRLNQLPNFVAEIEKERIHFVHVRGDGSKPPLLLLHGWPGSFLEFERLLDPLAADGHDVVVPSLPGFAFSKPISGVIGPRRAAELMHALMVELFGPSRYIVQGGDWGAAIASWMAFKQPEGLLGLHINMVNVLAADAAPSTPAEEDLLTRRAEIHWETGYSHEQETRPQTLGVAMADSPVGAPAGYLKSSASGRTYRRPSMAARTFGASFRRSSDSPT